MPPDSSPPETTSANGDTTDTEAYEQQHVHAVYDAIAPHFASTRHKPWPIIERFLRALPPASLGLDVGCGNGKYLPVNRDVFILGSDRSRRLVEIARRQAEGRGHEVVVADCLALPCRVVGGAGEGGGVDFAICIAVVHHLATRERRVAAIRAVLETLRAGGRLLVYVWALEQEGSRRGWREGGEQDVMVPWVMRGGKKGGEGEGEERVFQRYYHLYCKGELEEDVVAAGGEVVEGGYEKDNWWAIATRKPP